MAASVIGAIYDYFETTAAAALVSSSGGLWFDEVPEDKAGVLPLVALFHDGDEPPEYTAVAQYLRKTRVHFEAYAVGLDAISTLGAAVEAAFNIPETATIKDLILVTNAIVISSALGATKYELAGELASDSSKVYMVTVNAVLTTEWNAIL